MADQTLNSLLAFPIHPPNPQHTEQEYNNLARKHQESCAKQQHDRLSGTAKNGESFLEVRESPDSRLLGSHFVQLLNPAIHSISYLHVLLAHVIGPNSKGKSTNISNTFGPGGPLWVAMSMFMEQFDPIQIRYSGQDMRKLIEVTFTAATESKQVCSIPGHPPESPGLTEPARSSHCPPQERHSPDRSLELHIHVLSPLPARVVLASR